MMRVLVWTLLVATCLVVVVVNYAEAAHLNRSASASLFPDYPPSALHNSESKDEDEEANGELRTFAAVEAKMKSLIDDVIKKVLPFVIRSSADIRLSGRCMASILQLVLGMQRLQEWAIKMVDATGKPPSGVFRGTSMSLGDFDECVGVRVGRGGRPPTPGQREFFRGSYCTVECRLPRGILDAIDEYEQMPPQRRHNTSLGTSKTFLSMLLKYGQYIKVAAFRFGVCIPSTCGEEDLESISATIGKQVGFPLKVLHCQEQRELEFTLEQTIIVTVLTSLILIVLLCTVLERYYLRYPPNPTSTLQRCLHHLSGSLSVVSSTRRLVDVSTCRHPFPVLRGLFVLTVVINVLGHTYLMYNHLFFLKYSSVINYYEYMQQFSFSIIANGSNGVENYFFIAGFLITYIRWRKSAVSPKINLAKLIFKPYMRMSLLQLLVIGLFLLLPLVGGGPFWGDFVGPYLESCRQRWWLNLFYVNNYWASDDACLYHTWLLAAIMQLHLVAVIILWLLIKWPNVGFAFVIALVVGGMGAVGATVFLHKLPGALSMYFLDGVSGPIMWNTLFIKTFDHVGSFCIGLLTGFAVAKYKHRLNFGTATTCVLWVSSCVGVLAVFFGLYEYRHGGMRMPPSLAVLYAMLNRHVYALFLAWLTVACCTGKASFLPDVLGWRALVPIYRLSYLAYMLHLVLIYFHIGILRERMYLSHEENIINYFGYLVITFILSYLCYIFFQVPYTYLESLVLRKGPDQSTLPDAKAEEAEGKFREPHAINLTAKNIRRHIMPSVPNTHILAGKSRRDSQQKL